MSFFACTKYRLYFLSVSFCIAILLSGLLAACGTASSQPVASAMPMPIPTPSPTPSPTPIPSNLLRPEIERGLIYPQWGPTSYGASDPTWQQGIKVIQAQTGSSWLEIPVLLRQPTVYSTSIGPDTTAPTLAAFASGIKTATALGYHVFFVPLLGVATPGDWAGVVQIYGQAQQQAWFDSYWNALKPYAQVAQDNGVEQMAIGTEIVWMEDNAPASLWNQLISRVQSVFKGKLTYDMNWYPSVFNPPASWLKNPALSMIGLSEYIPLAGGRVDPSAIPALWRDKVRALVDTFSAQVGKPMILSEIGYRSTSDALSSPYSQVSPAPTDQQEQAGAYNAALSNVFADPRLVGVFFWGWDNVGKLGIAGMQAAQVVYKWYTKQAQ